MSSETGLMRYNFSDMWGEVNIHRSLQDTKIPQTFTEATGNRAQQCAKVRVRESVGMSTRVPKAFSIASILLQPLLESLCNLKIKHSREQKITCGKKSKKTVWPLTWPLASFNHIALASSFKSFTLSSVMLKIEVLRCYFRFKEGFA